MARIFFLKEIIHVFKILVMSPLIGSHGDRIGVFLNGSVDNFFNTSVMAQVNYLYTGRLDNAPHNVYCGIMTIKQGGSSDNSNVVLWGIRLYSLHVKKLFYKLQQI